MIQKIAEGLFGSLADGALVVIWTLMGLSLHCMLKCRSLEGPLASSTDVAAMMAILNEDTVK